MTTMMEMLRTGRRATALGLLAAALGAPLAGCSNDRLLSAEDPDLIDVGAVQNAEGAEALRVGAIGRLRTALFTGSASEDGMWLYGGLLADEWKSSNTFLQTNEVDQRVVRNDNSSVEATYRNAGRARTAALIALQSLRAYKPTATASAAQMFVAKGILELQVTESFCSGFSFSDPSPLAFKQPEGSDEVAFGRPLTHAQGADTALASFDSALAAVGTATDADAVRARNAARVGRGQALVALGRYAEAAAAVAEVPTTFTWDLTFSQTTGDNGIWSLNNNQRRYSVSDAADAKNALPFVAAKDARVPTRANGAGFDATVPNVAQLIWAARDSAVSLVNGRDARLVEAEAALQAGDYAKTLTIVNALRATYKLAPLVDPVTASARVDQFFREKAFFQFGRGQRLGDLRRLVRDYGRAAEEVFPTGAYFRGGTYGTDVNLPIPQAEQNNPNYRDANGAFVGCIDRKA